MKGNSKLDNNQFLFKEDVLWLKNELMYIANEEDDILSDYFDRLTKEQNGEGAINDLRIVYLPNIAERLCSYDIQHYYAPYLRKDEVQPINLGNDYLLQFLINDSDREQITHGLIRFDDWYKKDNQFAFVYRFYPLSSDSSISISEQLLEIENEIAKEQEDNERSARCYYSERIREKEKKEFDADEQFNYNGSIGDVSDLLEEVREKIYQLKQYGVPAHLLERLLYPEEKLSRLVVTKDYRIMLPDYNNMEIKMEPLVKAVYLMYLNHPEGIMFKYLPDHREELLYYYAKLKPNGINDRVLRSIEDVTNPLLNSINEKCARIRGAFVGQFDNHLAKHYYIDGERGKVKKISLPEDLVTWE